MGVLGIRALLVAMVGTALVALPMAAAPAGAAGGDFTNTPLIATWSPPAGLSSSPIPNSTGNSEPAIAFGADGAMAVDGLAWLPYQVNLWKGRFGETPSYFGAMDANLQNKGRGRITLGDGDADVEITAAGTTLLADLDFVVAPGGTYQLGVSVTRCPVGAAGPDDCTTAFLDKAGSDREWITSRGSDVWVAYHDAQNSTMIRVKKSTDDGRTWKPSGSPLVGNGPTTAGGTFNNSVGPIVADPTGNALYAAYMTGTPQSKCCSADYNQVFVARSTDGGAHWTSTRVYQAAAGTRLNNFWPAIAVDSLSGRVWVAWTDLHGVSVSSSPAGSGWTAPQSVSTATTTVMPWVAARGGKVDVVYYGSQASSTDDEDAVWNTFDSQSSGGSWSVKLVSQTPNRVGPVCLEGSGCEGNRELLDLFEVAEDPISGKAAVIYTDTTLNTWTGSDSENHQLPEIVLAFEQ
jgi:hypothetical protein